MCLILMGLLQRVPWRRQKKMFIATKRYRRNKKYLKDIHIVGPYFTCFTLFEKLYVCYSWLKCTETEEICKGNFKFFSFVSSSSNVYYRAVPCMYRICTDVWVLKFGSCSVATQQVNRIITDMCARWQWLPKTACRYAICSCHQSI